MQFTVPNLASLISKIFVANFVPEVVDFNQTELHNFMQFPKYSSVVYSYFYRPIEWVIFTDKKINSNISYLAHFKMLIRKLPRRWMIVSILL